MKKRFLCLTAYLLILILASACGTKVDDPNVFRVNVFYPDRDYMSLSQIERTLSGGSVEEKTGELIRAMSVIPFREEVQPALGNKAVVDSWELDGRKLHLDFTVSYNSLNKTEEVLTRAAVVETLSQLEDIDSVDFTVVGKPLKGPDGKEVGAMTKDTFINDMGDETNTYDRRNVTLYFTDMDGKKLKRYTETVVYTANMSVEKLIVQKLIEGPDREDYYPTLPRDVGLLGVTVKNGTCYVNFDSGIREKPYNVTESVVIYSITDSLTELDNVDNVQINVDGVSDGVLFDKMSLNTTYERNLELVK